jgi:hypothetical protein
MEALQTELSPLKGLVLFGQTSPRWPMVGDDGEFGTVGLGVRLALQPPYPFTMVRLRWIDIEIGDFGKGWTQHLGMSHLPCT